MNHEEAHALRRIAAILGAVSTPAERRNIALRIEDRISGRDSDPLAFALRHAAALFHPGDVAKTQDIRQRINAAFAAEELVTAIPKEHHHIMLSDLAAWPDRPPMAADSPLRFWVPDAPAQPQAATPAPVVADSASNAPVVPFKKAALVAAHVHEWPTIESDISDAATNGLAATAKAGARGWWEDAALIWARANGKLISAAKTADSLAQAMHNMGNLPSRKHTLQG